MDLSVIDELYGKFRSSLPLSEKQNKLLEDKLRLEFSYNSNHIEGNTLTYAETELLLITGDVEAGGNHSFREFQEMKASDVAYHQIQSLATSTNPELTEQFIKELNKTLLVEPYYKEATTLDNKKVQKKVSIGEYKKDQNYVTLENGEVFNFATAIETPAQMGDLIAWLRRTEEKKEIHPVEIAAELHYNFVKIHPFDDGNGRIARLLMNYILFKNGYPPVIIKSVDKKSYLRALRRADAGDLSLLKTYIGQQAIWSLELGLKAANDESLEEDEDWKKQFSIISRNLANRDTIKTVKSNEVIQSLIAGVLSSTANVVISNLSEFDDYFLRKGVFLGSSLRAYILNGQQLNIQIIEKHFSTDAKLIFRYDEFTKNPDNPFTIQVVFDVRFSRHKYEIFLGNDLVFKKLYHQTFTEKDLYQLTNLVGRVVTSEIEQKINTAI
jgi:Fic family protein